MKLKQQIIDRLQANRLFRLKVAVELDFSELWIDKLIVANKDNGPLTTAQALKVIKLETGLSDLDVLEETEPETIKS